MRGWGKCSQNVAPAAFCICEHEETSDQPDCNGYSWL